MSLCRYVAPRAIFQLSSHANGTVGNAGVELNLSSEMLDQPVYCASAIISHWLLILYTIDRFTISGIVMSELTPRPNSA